MSTFTKATEKAIQAYRLAETSPAWRRAAAFVIIAPMNPKDINAQTSQQRINYGKIKISYPADGMGRLNVFVWDCKGNDIQHGWASGCGYDKLSAALAGLQFDDIVFTDHPINWRMQLENAGYTVIQAI